MRFKAISIPTYGYAYAVYDTVLDRAICVTNVKADAILIEQALNKQEEKIQTELKLSGKVKEIPITEDDAQSQT